MNSTEETKQTKAIALAAFLIALAAGVTIVICTYLVQLRKAGQINGRTQESRIQKLIPWVKHQKEVKDE